MATPEKYAHIDFKPPQGAREEAEKSLAWRREFGRGGTAVGIARARDLANGVEVSPSTVRRMKAFFDRHQKNKSAPGWSPDEDGFPSNSRIAWAMWGSDAGWSWAKKVVEQMNAADEKNERGLRPYGSTHGMRPRVYVVHGAPCSGKKDYVASHLGENDVVFDYDEVMAAISGRPIYQPNSNLVSYCLDIRTLILKKALKSQDIGKTWVIATRVGDDMKSMLSDVPTQYVHIDKPKEECFQRLEQDEQRQPIAEELRKVIEEYFSENEEHRRAPLAQPGVERRFLGNFSSAERLDPELLRVEKRSDPETGKPQTYIVGYAARFHRDSLLLGDFVEQIDPGAFEIVTNRRDEDGKPLETRCLFNHDPNYLLGRFPTTMRMVVDDKGLKYECLLPEAHSGIAESIARGDLKGSSFSFVVAEGGERWTTENGQSRRIVTKVKSILDCGPVTYPAYSDASVAVAKRSYEGFVGVTKKPVVENRKKRLESLAKRAEVLRTRIAAEAFLAERRDCGRDEGGKFGSGNQCQESGKGGSANIAKAKKAQHDYEAKRKGGGIKEDKEFSSPDGKGGGLSGAIAGAVVGAAVGAAGGGLVGLAAGSLTGAAFGAVAGMKSASVNKARYEGLKEKTGISEDQVKKAAGIITGKGGKSASFAADGDTLMIESSDKNETMTFITAKSLFSKSEGTSVHVTAGFQRQPTDIRRVESAAKAVGASNVSVEAWSDEDAKSLKKSGYKMVVASGQNGFSSSKGVWEKKLKGKRSVENRDCGRGEDGKFGSGNKCQDDEGGGEPKSSPSDKYGGGDVVPKSKVPGKYGKQSSKFKESDSAGKKKAGDYGPLTPGGGKDKVKAKASSDALTGLPKKKSDDAYVGKSGKTDLLGREESGDGADWLGRKPRKTEDTPTKIPASKKKDTGGYMEWGKGKDAEAQDFIDTARKGQLKRGGKDKGKSDDGSGVQTWSKGDSYPWTTKQVGDSKKGGYVQGTHPDGSMTEKYKFPAGSDGSEAYKQAEDEIKKKTIRSLRSFLEARR
jgi:HK97 family phage prohead protease